MQGTNTMFETRCVAKLVSVMSRSNSTARIGVSQPSRTRSAGRPRLIPQASPDRDPREEILECAGRLFCSKGYEETSTREIALATGLQQASLFHYFARKQDMLTELLDRTLQPAVAHLNFLNQSEASPAAKLYLLVWADVRNICSQSYNLGSLMFQPVTRSADFIFFWEKRTRLRAGYRSIIEAGRKAGLFQIADSDRATNLIFGLVESAFIWFSADMRGKSESMADEVAMAALRVIVAKGSHAKIRTAARKIPIELQ